jgi:hypothetical protein
MRNDLHHMLVIYTNEGEIVASYNLLGRQIKQVGGVPYCDSEKEAASCESSKARACSCDGDDCTPNESDTREVLGNW